MNHSSSIAAALAVAWLAGCTVLPQYVRGDLRADGRGAIAPGASVAVSTALAPGTLDQPIRRVIEQSLAASSHPIVPRLDAELLVGFRYEALSADGRSEARGESDGFEAVWRGASVLDCPERFTQRLWIAAARNREGSAGELIWIGEICSDGGGSALSRYVGSFARELMMGFGMKRGPRRFEFLARDAGEKPETTVLASDPVAPSPLPPVMPGSGLAGGPVVVPALDALRGTPEVSDDGLVEPGPTWAAATRACAGVAERPGAGCSLLVVVATGSPILELGYPTRDAARESYERDVAGAGAIFCQTAERHGVRSQATVRISTPDRRSERSCDELDR